MSREFATTEIIRQKCSICGSKNKLYTEFKYKGIHYGYQLTCCNCGHIDEFMDAYRSPSGIVMGMFSKGREVCIRFQDCKHTECPYYGKGSIWDAKTTIDDAFNDQNDGTDDDSDEDENCCNCGCKATSFQVTFDDGKLVIGKSNPNQLDINKCDDNNPRFH